MTRTRRAAFIALLIAVACGAFLPHVLAGAQPANTRRPNIVDILLEDTGFSDVAPDGSEIARRQHRRGWRQPTERAAHAGS